MINFELIKTLIDNKEKLNSPLIVGNDEGAKFVRHEILKAHYVAKFMGLATEEKALLKIYDNYFAHLGYTGECINLINRKFMNETYSSLFSPLAAHGVLSFEKMIKHLELYHSSELNNMFDLDELSNEDNPTLYSQSFLRSTLDIDIGNKTLIESKYRNCWISIDELDTIKTYNGKPIYHLVGRHTDIDSKMSYKVFKKYR